MNPLRQIIAAAILGLAIPASAEIIGVEPFDYAPGSIDGRNGGAFWDYQNILPHHHTGTPSNWDNVSGAPDVSARRLVTNNHSAKREYNGANEGEGAISPSSVAQKVYYRVNVKTGAALPAFFGLSSYNGGTEVLFFGKLFNNNHFGVQESGVGSTATTLAVATNTTYTLVARLDFAVDDIRLYVNPDLNAPEPATATVFQPYAGNSPSTAVRLASGTGGAVAWDGLVVATAWEDFGTIVTTTADTGTGSLRQALLNAAANPGPDTITFAPTLSGQTIALTGPNEGSAIDITDAGDVTIDATSLPGGLTIDDGTAASFRLLSVANGSSLTLRGLTLANGGGIDFSGGGGAILNDGTLTLTHCTLSGNYTFSFGGAILNYGTLTLTHCTLSGNSASNYGGAIANAGTLTLTHCTLSGNSADISGGAIENAGTLTLTHCTLSGNSADFGGAIHNNGPLTLTNSIVAGNTAVGGGGDIYHTSNVNRTRVGANIIQSVFAEQGGVDSGPPASTDAPLLSPLGNYGGPTQTMALLPGSPAINAAVGSPSTSDQRGFPLVGTPDIGAYEAGLEVTLTVATTDNSGPGSLRQAVINAANNPGPDTITFAPTLSGQTIALTGPNQGSAIDITDAGDVTIDATSLPGGLSIDGGPAVRFRLLSVASGTSLTLRGITLTNGGGTSFSSEGGAIYNSGTLTLTHCTLSGNSTSGSGGAIFNSGTLTLTHCTLSGNSTSISGGAIFNSGTLTLTHCTLSGNSADYGGAIFNSGALTLTHCTLSGNSSISIGGAIYNADTLTLTHCTLSGNSADYGGAIDNGGTVTLTHCTLSGNSGIDGGAIFNSDTLTLTHCTLSGNSADNEGGAIFNSGTVTLTNSIVAGNTGAGGGGDIYHASNSNRTRVGANIIQSVFAGQGGMDSGPPASTDAPLLSPLGNYGGPTQTMALLPGSPAINAAVGSPSTSDQRGFPLVGTPDIGAYEAGLEVTLTVATTDNSGPGSLRQAVINAANNPGPDTITFAPTLSGLSISLTGPGQGSAIDITDAGGVTIDATSLPGGLTIQRDSFGNTDEFRLLSVANGSSLTLRGLTLANGGGFFFFEVGGAIYNNGTLTLTHCTLSGNSTQSFGGAIYNAGTLTLTHGTLSGNSTQSFGGAIYNTGTLTLTHGTLSGNSAIIAGGAITGSGTLTHCTLTGNTTSGDGGAINVIGTVTLRHCTVAGNPASGSGGGVFVSTGPVLVLENSIVAGNSLTGVGSGPDIYNGGTVNATGANLVLSTYNLPGVGTVNGSGTITLADPRLAPLADNGGPTRTMALLPGSPAINAAVGSPSTSDQRGFPLVGTPDIGAYEAGLEVTLTVATTDNSGPGSLRQAVINAANNPGPDTITFASALSGQTITLTSFANLGNGNTAIAINDPGGVTIDATSLPDGLTIQRDSFGNTDYFRLLFVASGSSLTLRGLTLANGGGPVFAGDGGAIYSAGTLTLTHCTLAGNRTNGAGGGAIANGGTLTLTHCTLSGNSGHYGGAISNFGTLTPTHCTFSENSAYVGGAIYNDGTLTLTHGTLSGNSANFGGAIYNLGPLTLTNSIVAGNSTTGQGGDFYHTSNGHRTRVGANIIQSVFAEQGGMDSGPPASTDAPLLSPLGNYGGPTQTMALLPGSPARNAAVGSTITSDQRGFPIIGTPDIGAYEAGTFSNYPAYIWESLPTAGNGTITDPLHASTHDFDGDGATNGEEWQAETDAGAFSSALRFVSMQTSGGVLSATFPTVAGRTYRLQSTDDLTPPQTWTDTDDVREGDGNSQTFSPLPSGRAYRVMVDPR